VHTNKPSSDNADYLDAALKAVPEKQRIEILRMLERHSADWCRLAYDLVRTTEPNYGASAFFRIQVERVNATVHTLEQAWRMKQEDYLP
jgi:hypothetical protein